MKKTFLLMVGVVLCLVVVFILGWEEVYSIISRISITQLLLLTMLQLGTLFSTTYILHYLLKQKSPKVSLGSVFGINLAGSFVESVTPSVKVGGEALKVYLMQKETGLEYSQLTAITLMSKFFSMLPFLGISFVTLAVAFFSYEVPIFVYVAFIGLLLFFILFLLLFNLQGLHLHVLANKIFNKGKIRHPLLTKILHKSTKIYAFMIETSIQSKTLISAGHKRIFLFSIAFMVWALYPVKVYLVARMLGYELSVIVVIIATYTAYLVSMVPLLPGGLATFEGSMALVLAYEHLASHEAFSIALMTRVITFWIPLLISGVVMIYYLNKAKTLKQPNSKNVESR
ncbi:lysylphosphatidylglycerol synthase transmembrane domain-containing protein [Serpentinicella sp. ANB-PHB4]|uniref:lysylphosphatidylglycerol synthase transmembrane domain-containing protein n=1 Tax=Serpentinicella sp. ANB-PHB4 TaxID=3074076 RepID=UPI00285D767D|nr:lysylphosphatidylglycerol synthase transmembrane domain-containing protein [Serpentinicella sp. ANB-PHB4]MDR5658554.1 lysylphosphatidylglycerol synthase transmembrane domain-containing protein [Serpentinicella sp. ANB-PHB4]